ncbi:MAG: polymerase subunit sigma-70 [Phycisphaerales bacterium]|nr:polymerase subunit sigma-70 [Phycisphaerales bacterium]
MPDSVILSMATPAAEPERAAIVRPAVVDPAVTGTDKTTDDSDERLFEGLRTGDAAAGDALVRRYAAPLLRYLQRLVGDELAEELHQQTWVSVLDNLDRFEPGRFEARAGSGGPAVGGAGAFKAWLFRIATNKANDLWRSRGRERVMKQNLRLVTSQEGPDAGHGLEGREADEVLVRAIQRLPEAQRQILALRYYSGMKFADIAALLGCPLNTALGRVHKALAKLRRAIEE